MEPWHHHRQLAFSETWFLPSNATMPQPELVHTRSIADPILTSHSQARLDATYPTTDNSLHTANPAPSFTLHQPNVSNAVSNGPPSQGNYLWPDANRSEMHHRSRTQSIVPQVDNAMQELPEVHVYPKHTAEEWQSRRANIKKFYKDEKGDLRATRSKMMDLGFHAS